MKFGRVFLLVVAGVGVLLLLAVAAAFNSGVQTWAVRRSLASRPGLPITVGRVDAGWNHVIVENVHLVQSGAVLTMPSAEGDLPVASAVRGKVLLRRLVAKGWTLDLSHLRPTSKAALHDPAPPEFSLIASAYAQTVPAVTVPVLFSGIFNQLNLPVDLALDGVDLEGVVILPEVPNQPVARAKVTIKGGGLAAGKPGKFDYTAVVAFEGANAPVREVTFRGLLGVIMDTPRTLARLVASNEAEAVGPNFPSGVKLNFDISAARSTHGEVYAVSISSGTKQLAAMETSYPAGASHLGGNWRVDMRDSDLAPFSFGRELPTFEAIGEGSFDTDTAFAELRASGKLNVTADRLAVIVPHLSGLGAVHATAEFDFAQREDATRVDQLAVTIEGARPIATVQALQAFEFNLRTGELNVADPSKELLGVVFQGLPLAWFGPWLSKEGFAISGDDLQGGFSASARNGGFTLRPKGALTIGNLSVGKSDGTQMLAGVDVSLTASADYTPQGWQVEVSQFSTKSAVGTILSLDGKFGQLAGVNQPLKATGNWSAQLPAIFAQPVAGGSRAVTAGDAQGTVAASLGTKQEGELKISLTNLAATGAPTLPAVTVNLRADREATGKVTFSAPVRLEREGRTSDITFAGTIAPPTASGVTIDARVTSDFLEVEDAQILAAPLAVPTQPRSKAPTTTTASAPFWSGINGQVSLALKKVVYNGQFQVTDLTGTLQIDAGSIKLANGRGGFDAESDVKLDGGVTYNKAATSPYTLAADFALNNFATAPAFRAIDATKQPTVEARINLTSKLTGAGVSISDLADKTRGDLLITSKGGIFRGLSADLTDRIQKTQSRVTAIASFLGVVTDDFVNKTKILSDIAKFLSEIPFDQLSVTATRDASLNFQLKDFSLISPEVRIVGEGEVRYTENVPILAQPMTLQLNLGARGKLGDLIKRAGLLDARQDNLGYAAFAVPLKIGGTLANPDTNEIRSALLNSALERSGLLDSLMGK